MKTTEATTTRLGARAGSGLFDELIVDNFAGAGGASMGIEAALGRSVDIAVNHDRHSVWMHQVNHPHTRHLCEDVWDVDPIEATGGRPVGLAWFSPDCRHFSRAKGGKPVQKRIRGLAWVVIRWAKVVKPRVIILENVREFQEWGPLTTDDRPCPNRKGQTFKRWRRQLENLGYVVEHRILNAADFGAPTHRRRLFLVARCDGLPIHWPEPTHGPGRGRSYRTAAECIDWSLPCPSIFLTKQEAKTYGVIRPLAEKTMRRIAMGLKRYVLDNPRPFIVTCNHGGPEFRGQSIGEPAMTLTAARDAHGDTSPNGAKRWGRGEQDPGEPLPTLTASKDFAVAAPYLIRTDHHQSHATNAFDARSPIGTITSAAGHAVIAPTLVQTGYGEREGQAPRAIDIDKPIGTLVGSGKHALMAASLTKYHGQKGNESCAKSLMDPLPTADTSNRFGVVSAFLAKHYGGVVGHDVERPIGTITSVDHHSVVASHLTKFYGTNTGADVQEPAPTVTAGGYHLGEVRAFLMRYYSSGGQAGVIDAPAPTITTKDRLGVVTVQGQDYQIVDIGLRMLAPAELLRAQFGKYAKGYVLLGTKSQQVAKIGNSVPPELAEAVVRANFAAEVEVAA